MRPSPEKNNWPINLHISDCFSFYFAQALDNDFGVYGSIKYSIVYEQDPGIFSLSPLTGEVTLTNPSSLVAGKEQYALAISAADNLAIVPYNSVKQNASVHVSLKQ